MPEVLAQEPALGGDAASRFKQAQAGQTLTALLARTGLPSSCSNCSTRNIRFRGYNRPHAALALAAKMRQACSQPFSLSERIAMSYSLDQFASDCRAILKRDPGPHGREEVRTRLERLLHEKDFVDQYCGPQAPRGLKVLYEDPELGFQILAHINDKARMSPPHDHGASWAIYGQATHYTDMIEWEREDNGDAEKAKLKPVKKYRLMPGHAGIYQDGTIHSIDYPDSARFIRVTGTNLDNIQRVRFDLATGEVHQMHPQQAT
jgi:predicted metal-dependent enzyme (double-stranded beta helix superfamily)